MMDGQMPVMDGFEATARIRALDGPRARVHIVAVTANAMAGDEERFLGAGMDDYLPKPVTLRALRDIVDRWLTRRQVAVAPGRPTTAEAGPTLH
jgi:two-component system sensor histidine kinase/response regulator